MISDNYVPVDQAHTMLLGDALFDHETEQRLHLPFSSTSMASMNRSVVMAAVNRSMIVSPR